MRGSESKRHNKALQTLEEAQSQWTSRRMETLDFINEELRKQGHSIQTFKDVEAAMHECFLVYGKELDSMPKPTISQFYKSVLYTIRGTKKTQDNIDHVGID